MKKNLIGKIVAHKKSGNLGIVVKENKLHKGFWRSDDNGKN